MDMRKRARLPFGYRVEKGEIVIDQAEAEMLMKYFCFYLEGKSMSSAAREAGISASYTALIHMLERKAYTGSDSYPALISKDYHALLLAELERRRSEKKDWHESKRSTCLRQKKRVKIYTDFLWAEEKNEIETDLKLNPALFAAMLYRRIRPVEAVD